MPRATSGAYQKRRTVGGSGQGLGRRTGRSGRACGFGQGQVSKPASKVTGLGGLVRVIWSGGLNRIPLGANKKRARF